MLPLELVSYQYQGKDGERSILGAFDLTFNPGELVFIVGNGSGKTTLANLLVDLSAIHRNGQLNADDQREAYR